MIVEGKILAQNVQKELMKAFASVRRDFTVSLFSAPEGLAAQKFIESKKKVARELGVTLRPVDMAPMRTTKELLEDVLVERADGIIVQLPLPARFDAEEILSVLPQDKDLDRIGSAARFALREGGAAVWPPVVGACAHILHTNDISVAGKEAVVVGKGRLVGEGAALWLMQKGARVTSLDIGERDLASHTRTADIVVMGAGHPGLLTPSMVKEGVIILDAGTSESEGKLLGDADPACAARASLFTPTPGGIGPLAVAMIFKNLLALNGIKVKD